VLRDAHGRVARWLLERSGAGGLVELPTSRKHLASHLNLTPETLSRTLRRFEEECCIRQDDRGIVVLAPARLTQAAEGLFPKL
jgi:CRP/FNR family transcriptional regulator, dissimilatory nitrate respiration regulator